ncbi:TIGR02265 family protein [Cystobacter fuscus]|nr:TIGR02265 family protein [Cystobacter fuscus]
MTYARNWSFERVAAQGALMAVNDSVGLGGAKADAWERELTRRSGLVAERHTVRGMYFNGTLDALRSLGHEPLVRRCVEESGESHFLDFFNYPARLHYRMVSTALPALAEEYGGAEEGLRRLGQQVARRVWGLGVGKVMLSLSPLSPWQLQSALPMAYRSSVSFGEYEVRWMGPCSGRLMLKQDFMPYPFHEGVVKTSLDLWGGRAVRVSGRQTGGLDSECDFWWQ